MAQRFILIRKMVSEKAILDEWRRFIAPLTARRVICHDPNVTWNEKSISSDSEIASYLQQPSVLESFRSLDSFCQRPLREIMLWASYYKLGEYIHRHRDSDGDFQLVLCLKATEDEEGGALCLQLDNSVARIQLREGDAVFFKATEMEHWTTRLTIAPGHSAPSRVTIACRYWFHKEQAESMEQ